MPPNFEKDHAVSSAAQTGNDSLRRPLTLLEWIEFTGVCKSSAYELARAGQIPGLFRLGRSFYVSRDVTERLLKTGVA